LAGKAAIRACLWQKVEVPAKKTEGNGRDYSTTVPIKNRSLIIGFLVMKVSDLPWVSESIFFKALPTE